MNSKVAAIFMAIGFAGVINSDTALPVMYRLREVFYRERASNTYHHSVWSTLIGIVELPYVFATCVCFLIPFYFLVGFENNATKFFEFLLSLCVSCSFLLLRGTVLQCPHAQFDIGNSCARFQIDFFLLIHWDITFISVSDIPVGWMFVYYINPLPKAIMIIAEQ